MSGLSSIPSIDVVRIKLKHHDWEIEVTCSENKVKEIVANVLSGLDSAFIPRYEELKKEIDLLNLKSDSSTQINSLLPRTSKRVAHQSSGYTCRSVLEKLLYDGYFKTERLLRNNERITQKDIATASGVTEVTIKNRFKDLKNHIDE